MSGTALVRCASAVAVAAAVAGAWAAGAVRQGAPTLPAPVTSGGMSLNEALAKRRSVRTFTGRALTAAQVSQLCWAAQGITQQEKGLRTAPSAMALYPVRVYVVDGAGTHEYVPKQHALRTLRADGVVADLRAMAGGASSAGGAPAFIVLGLDLAPLAARAGPQAERYGLLEAGHVAQNILLQATALGLGSIPVGGIDEAKAAAVLKLPAGIRPVYLLPIGHPAAP